MFAHQYNNIIPDILTLAKGLGNGVPIGACLAKGKTAILFTPGTHGSTFGGNPLVCKTAISVLEVIEKDNLLDNATKMGGYLTSNFQEKLSNSNKITQIIGTLAFCAKVLMSLCEDTRIIMPSTIEPITIALSTIDSPRPN
jgi:acetylornithine aminotransferase